MLLSIAGRPPEDQAIRTLHTALDQGVSFIDTADAYCLNEADFNHSERLIAKALRGRHDDVVVATKCACRRPGGAWTVDARPEYLMEAAEASLRALEVETLELLQLHAPDSRVPFADSVGALARLREQGKVRHVGLCNVNVAQLEEARKIVPIASVQNRWNVEERQPERDGMLDYCARHRLAFLPYSPFGGTRLAPTLATIGRLGEEAKRRRISAYRLILAWMLAKSPIAVPIFGARRPESVLDSTKVHLKPVAAEDVKSLEAAMIA